MNPTTDTPEKPSSAPAEAKKTDPKPKNAKKLVAKKKSAKTKAAPNAAINKSEEIRRTAKELQGKGEAVRPKTIVDLLKKRGITVAPPQVSMVLKQAGFRSKRRRKKIPGAVGSVAKKTSRSLSVDDLLKAKKMADDFGGAEKLVNAISKLVELQ